jgi:hypothetical protein
MLTALRAALRRPLARSTQCRILQSASVVHWADTLLCCHHSGHKPVAQAVVSDHHVAQQTSCCDGATVCVQNQGQMMQPAGGWLRKSSGSWAAPHLVDVEEVQVLL